MRRMYREKTGEEWKLITGYPLYDVSNFGRVRSRQRMASTGMLWLLSSGCDYRGYVVVRLKPESGPPRSVGVHRLVASAFIPNFECKPEVNHKDMDRTNNAAANLEWVTHRENLAHARGILGNWSSRERRKRCGRMVSVVDPVDKSAKRFRSMTEAVEWISKLQVANGGVPLHPQSELANITRAIDRSRIALGCVWSSRCVTDVPEFLNGLKPLVSRRSPLWAMLNG